LDPTCPDPPTRLTRQVAAKSPKIDPSRQNPPTRHNPSRPDSPSRF
jgi:hypothetical protein